MQWILRQSVPKFSQLRHVPILMGFCWLIGSVGEWISVADATMCGSAMLRKNLVTRWLRYKIKSTFPTSEIRKTLNFYI